jgi:hypothetical protein
VHFGRLFCFIIHLILESSVHFIVVFHHTEFLLPLVLAQVGLRSFLLVDKVIDLVWISQLHLDPDDVFDNLVGAGVEPGVGVVEVDEINEDISVYFVLLGEALLRL